MIDLRRRDATKHGVSIELTAAAYKELMLTVLLKSFVKSIFCAHFQHKPRPPLKSSLKTGLGMMSEESIRCRDHGHVYWSKSLLFGVN